LRTPTTTRERVALSNDPLSSPPEAVLHREENRKRTSSSVLAQVFAALEFPDLFVRHFVEYPVLMVKTEVPGGKPPLDDAA
jgi:hypothetical protein